MPNLPRLLRLLIAGDDQQTADFPLHGVVALERGDDGSYTEVWRMTEDGEIDIPG